MSAQTPSGGTLPFPAQMLADDLKHVIMEHIRYGRMSLQEISDLFLSCAVGSYLAAEPSKTNVDEMLSIVHAAVEALVTEHKEKFL